MKLIYQYYAVRGILRVNCLNSHHVSKHHFPIHENLLNFFISQLIQNFFVFLCETYDVLTCCGKP